MNLEMDYQQKYLKYKKKYLELKEQQKELNLNEDSLSGGYAYMAGKYVFFVPESTSDIVDTVGSDKHIKSLDKFTTSLGNCAKFIRIGSLSVDPTHQYDSLYANQSSFSVFSREASKAAAATASAAKQAYNASADAYDVASKAAVEAYKKTSEVAKKTYKGIQAAKQAYNNSMSHGGSESSHEGGAENCLKTPVKLSDIGLTGIKSLVDVNEQLVNKYVSEINNIQGSERIGRVIVVEKTGMFGNVYLYQDFVVSYDGDNISGVTKK